MALLVGLLGLLAGVAGLERVFLLERQEALGGLARQQAALEGYAGKDLQERCRDDLRAERPRLRAALADPLVESSGLVYTQGGRQRLPRQFTFRDELGETMPLYDRLISGQLPTSGLEDDDPWLVRLRYLGAYRAALESHDRAAIERAFRAILTHRLRYVIDSGKDLVYQVVLLDLLEERSEPDPELMRLMLRDGVSDSRGVHTPGLQRQLLKGRDRLTRTEFQRLAGRILELSEAYAVRQDDFRDRLTEPSGPTIVVPEALVTPLMLAQGAWYVEPTDGDAVEGTAIDLEALLDRTQEAMRDRGLLENEDILSMAALSAPSQPLGELSVVVLSPRWDRSRTAIGRRFWLKTGLSATLVAAMGGAVFLWTAWTRRERQLLALKSDFVAAASHELRTPLASMRLMAETLERRLDGLDAARDYPGRLIREIDALDFGVGNILSFARLEKGRWVPRVSDVRLSEIVRTLERELPGATTARLEVEFEDSKDITFRADPELMKLLFMNLGTNACKYNSGNPVVLRIDAEDRRPLVIRVADNGIGVPEAEAERVFSEFYRAERGGRGFGLGLAICRRIMDLHAGHIRIAESSTAGTVFEMSFP